jgi:hypothetical protein
MTGFCFNLPSNKKAPAIEITRKMVEKKRTQLRKIQRGDRSMTHAGN